MRPAPRFEDLLPASSDPTKTAIRSALIAVLSSQGEVVPSANSPRGKLWHLVNSPDSSIDECEEVIKLDTALSARIFRVANSATYGVEADNISEALQRLGLKFVREQVFNAGVFKQYAGWKLPKEWDLFWLRNIFVARLCERISATYVPTNGTEYLAGLIHDIGWLFLATYLPEEFTNIFASGLPIAEAEQERLPFGHAEIAGAIAARSLLPARAVEGIQQHHQGIIPDFRTPPGKSPYFLGIVLRICDQVADCCKMDMFSHFPHKMEFVEQGPEAAWLNGFAPLPDLFVLAEEELAKSQEIFDVYFSNRQFN